MLNNLSFCLVSIYLAWFFCSIYIVTHTVCQHISYSQHCSKVSVFLTLLPHLTHFWFSHLCESWHFPRQDTPAGSNAANLREILLADLCLDLCFDWHHSALPFEWQRRCNALRSYDILLSCYYFKMMLCTSREQISIAFKFTLSWLFTGWLWQTEIFVTHWWNISISSGLFKYVKRMSCQQNTWSFSCGYPPLPPTRCKYVIFLTRWSKPLAGRKMPPPLTTLNSPRTFQWRGFIFYSSRSPVNPGLKLLVSSARGCVFMKGFTSFNQYPTTFQFKIFLANLLYQPWDSPVINLYTFALFMAWHVTSQQHCLGPLLVSPAWICGNSSTFRTCQVPL